MPGATLGFVNLNDRLAPSALLVFACVETASFGSNFRLGQFVTWNGTPTALIPSAVRGTCWS
jgi:hypothetical protein